VITSLPANSRAPRVMSEVTVSWYGCIVLFIDRSSGVGASTRDSAFSASGGVGAIGA
jgi:hypothetical protein